MSRFGFITGDLVKWGEGPMPGGCAYYRCVLPMMTVPEPCFGPPAWTADRGFGVRINKQQAQFGFDTIVIKQIMDRWMPEQMRQAQALGQRLIVDVDDAYDFLHDENQAKRATDPELNKVRNRNHMRDIIMQADIVTVSTPFLLAYYSAMRDNVFMVRNGINPDQFERRKVRNVKPVIGWAAGLRWRSSDTDVLKDWLGDFLIEHDLMFHHAGHDPSGPSFADLANVPVERVITSPMKPIVRYQEMLTFDIGLVPLTDIPFNHAKSFLKGIEYAAGNIPFVASALPEYQILAKSGVGRVAGTPDEWVGHLTELLDYRTRKREAAVQREIVLREHTIRARASEWNEVFQGSPETKILSKMVEYIQVAQ